MEVINHKGDYKALPSYIEVRTTLKKGEGLFTTKQLQRYDTIGCTHYEVAEEDRAMFHQGLVRPVLGEKLNHSSKPNCRLVQKGRIYYLQVLHPIILPNSELTIDYSRYRCGESYMCVKKVDEVMDELKYFDAHFRQSDDHDFTQEQAHKEQRILGMIRKLSDVEKGELCEKIDEGGNYYIKKHFSL